MRVLFIFYIISFLSCNAQNKNQIVVSEEYKIINLVLNDFSLKQFIFFDENRTERLTSGFKAYINWYIKYLETGKSTPMASEDIEWILNSDDIGFISAQIEYETVKEKWDKNQIMHQSLIYASDNPELANSKELPRPAKLWLSKPYLNKNKTKAVIFRITEFGGFLVLVKKVKEEWVICGKIEYMFS